jgi:hypothetical protein
MSLIILFILNVGINNHASAIEPPRVAKDLRSSRELIKSKGNKQLYDYEIGNTNIDPSDEKLGKLGKDDPIVKSLIEQLGINQISAEERRELSFGIKQLPYQQDSFISWAYIGEVVYPMVDEKNVSIPADKQKENINPRLALGLFKRDNSKSNQVIMAGKPIFKIGLRQRETLASFDFVPYNLGFLGRAFGLRTNVGGCGAGGSLCSNQYLKLFVIQDGELTEVFNEAISYFGDIAGDWHKNGTRDHSIEEINGFIKVVNSDSSNLPDLLLEAKEKRKTKRRFFKPMRINGSHVVYKTTDPQIIYLVDEI